LTATELNQRQNALSPNSKQPCFQIAEQQLQRGPHLVGDIPGILLKTKGSITWHQLEAQLAGGEDQVPIASREATRRHVMGLPNSLCTTTTTIYPHLTESAKHRRIEWSRGFWLF